jgi:hypothetical protein
MRIRRIASAAAAKEVATAVPLLRLIDIHETEVRLVNERGRLEGLPRRLASQTLRGELPKFRVDQGKQLLGGAGVTTSEVAEDARYRVHGF